MLRRSFLSVAFGCFCRFYALESLHAKHSFFQSIIGGCLISVSTFRFQSIRSKVHRIFYILLLTLLAGSAVTSNFMMNLAWTLLFANWVVEWDMRRKFSNFGNNCMLHYAAALFLITAIGLVWSDSITDGLDCLRQALPLIVIPLVVLTSQPMNRRQCDFVAVGYIGTVFVVTVIGIWRWMSIPDLPYRRIVPYISHIRFSLNLCLSICIIAAYILSFIRQGLGYAKTTAGGTPAYRKRTARGVAWRVVCVAMLLALVSWFVFYLFLLQSYTGLVILFATGVALLFFGIFKIQDLKTRIISLVVAISGVCGLSLVCLHYVDEYYSPRLSQVDGSLYTANGNRYTFSNDGLTECGRKVNDFVCEKEIRSGWAAVSGYPIDSLTPVGYSVYPTLLRYLNAMGLPKDSVGVSCLSPKDISLIEQGVANPVYAESASVRRMVYVMLFEYESYRCFHTVKGFTMLQRIELWKAAWSVARRNWVHGVGTGDVEKELDIRLQVDNSPMAGTHMYPHNQYLTHMVSYGMIAFGVLFAIAVRAFVRLRLWRKPLWMACAIIVFLSWLTEDTLNTSAGAVFAALSLSLLSTVRHTG